MYTIYNLRLYWVYGSYRLCVGALRVLSGAVFCGYVGSSSWSGGLAGGLVARCVWAVLPDLSLVGCFGCLLMVADLDLCLGVGFSCLSMLSGFSGNNLLHCEPLLISVRVLIVGLGWLCREFMNLSARVLTCFSNGTYYTGVPGYGLVVQIVWGIYCHSQSFVLHRCYLMYGRAACKVPYWAPISYCWSDYGFIEPQFGFRSKFALSAYKWE